MRGRKVNFGIRNEVSGALLRTFPSLSVYLCAVAKEEPRIGRRVCKHSPLRALLCKASMLVFPLSLPRREVNKSVQVEDFTEERY